MSISGGIPGPCPKGMPAVDFSRAEAFGKAKLADPSDVGVYLDSTAKAVSSSRGMHGIAIDGKTIKDRMVSVQILLSRSGKVPSVLELRRALEWAQCEIRPSRAIPDESDLMMASTVLETIVGHVKVLTKDDCKVGKEAKAIYARAALELAALQLESGETWYADAKSNLGLAEKLGNPGGEASYFLGKILLTSALLAPPTYDFTNNLTKVLAYFKKSTQASISRKRPFGHAGSRILTRYAQLLLDNSGNLPDDAWEILGKLKDKCTGESYKAEHTYYLGKLGYKGYLGDANKTRWIHSIEQNIEELTTGDYRRAKSHFYVGENNFMKKTYAIAVRHLIKSLGWLCHSGRVWRYLRKIQAIFDDDGTEDKSLNVCQTLAISRDVMAKMENACRLPVDGFGVSFQVLKNSTLTILEASKDKVPLHPDADPWLGEEAEYGIGSSSLPPTDEEERDYKVLEMVESLELRGHIPTWIGMEYIKDNYKELFLHVDSPDILIRRLLDTSPIYLDTPQIYGVTTELDYASSVITAVSRVISNEMYEIFLSQYTRSESANEAYRDLVDFLKGFEKCINILRKEYDSEKIDFRWGFICDPLRNKDRKARSIRHERHARWDVLWKNYQGRLFQGLDNLSHCMKGEDVESCHAFLFKHSIDWVDTLLVSNIYEGLEDFVMWYMEKKGLPLPDRANFFNYVLEERFQSFNRAPWNAIEKHCALTLPDKQPVGGGEPHFISKMIPFGGGEGANGWNLYYSKPFGEKNGICTHDRLQYDNMPGAMLTELKTQEAEPKTLFRAIRHGVLDAYNIKPGAVRRVPDLMRRKMLGDLLSTERGKVTSQGSFVQVCKDMRKQASVNFARELVVNAVLEQGKMDMVLTGEAVEVTISSIGLLTPTKLNGEDVMLKNQLEAYSSLNGQDLDLMVHDACGLERSIKVKPKFIPWNCGVNFMYHRLGMGKSPSRDINVQAIKALLTEVGEYHMRVPRPTQEETALVTNLVSQIQFLSSNLGSTGNEYALPVRIAFLSYLLGHTVAFNCKSGKDRTGILDAQIKFFISYYRHTGELLDRNFYPQGDVGKLFRLQFYRPKPPPKYIKRSIVSFLFDSGSLEVQRMLAGFPGYKVQLWYEPWIDELFDNPDERDMFRGGASRVRPQKV